MHDELELTREQARAQVAARAAHFFSVSLVESQFAALEPPVDEAGLWRVSASASIAQLQLQVCAWLRPSEAP